MATYFENLFGAQLQTKEGMRPTSEVLAGVEAVGVYFSAHWCPPCKQFTPILANRFKAINKDSKRWAVVFVSADRKESEFNEYFGTMPWAAVPFSNKKVLQEVPGKFQVRGIPSLKILAPDGSVIRDEAREPIMNPEAGPEFPFAPPTFAEALGEKLMKSDGTIVPVSALEGKKLAFYFSAHWCGPCRVFTPQLVERYNKWVAAEAAALKDKFEVIFVSADHSAEEFAGYFSDMPWLAVPFDQAKHRAALSTHFAVQSYPTAIITDSEGNIINKEGRAALLLDNSDSGEQFPFAPPAVVDMHMSPNALNEGPTAVLLMGKTSAEARAPARAAFEAVGKAHAADSIAFLYEDDVGRVSSQIRKLTAHTETDRVSVLITDIPSDGKFYTYSDESVTEEGLEAFLSAFKAHALPAKQMRS